MADSRLTFAQWMAAFDNIAKAIQIAKATIGDAFDTSATETTGTLRETARYLLETRIRAYTSDDALARLTPPALNSLAVFDKSTSTNDLLANIYGPVIAALCNHQVAYGSDLLTGVLTKRYSEASACWAALWADAGSTAANKRVLGEVVDIMAARGMRWDPAYAVPPEHLELARITFSGAATATFVTKAEIDPLKYTGHDVELYTVARGTPASGTMTFTCKDETDTATDTAGTDFTATIGTDAAGTVIAVAQTDSHVLHSTRGGTLVVTGGENGLILALRVKQFRAAAK